MVDPEGCWDRGCQQVLSESHHLIYDSFMTHSHVDRGPLCSAAIAGRLKLSQPDPTDGEPGTRAALNRP